MGPPTVVIVEVENLPPELGNQILTRLANW